MDDGLSRTNYCFGLGVILAIFVLLPITCHEINKNVTRRDIHIIIYDEQPQDTCLGVSRIGYKIADWIDVENNKKIEKRYNPAEIAELIESYFSRK